MKPSHFTTPRSLEECHFDPRGQAVFTPDKPVTDKTLYIWFVLFAIFAALVVAFT